MCRYWLEEHINNHNSATYIDAKNPVYQNVEIGGVAFDFAYQKDRNVYAYFDTVPGKGLNINLWQKIDAVTSKYPRFIKTNIISAPQIACRTAFGRLAKPMIMYISSLGKCSLPLIRKSTIE